MTELRNDPPNSTDEFLSGPCERFLEFASEPDLTTRASARVLEFLRQAVLEMTVEAADRGELREDRLFALVRAKAADTLSQRSDWRQLVRVIDGTATHNSV